MKDFVEEEKIRHVIDGLKKFHLHILETGNFNCSDFKNFMEPIFQREGYRDKNLNNATNILIIHDAGVGDFILMSAAIREIRRLYPKAHITMVVYSRALNFAEFCPYVDEIISNARICNWADFMDNYLWNMNFVRNLLIHRFDIAYAFTHYDSTPMLAYMSGAKNAFLINSLKKILYLEQFLVTFSHLL